MTEPAASRFGVRLGNSFVLPDHKVVYVSVTKVACTGLKWMVTDLGGEDLEVFRRGATRQQGLLMKIHRGRHRYSKVRSLRDYTLAELAEVHPDNGWFIFAMVRDPWSRLWSAWESKFLVRHHRYVTDFADRPFFPRVPTEASFVVEDFRRFVEMRPWLTDPILSTDLHFQPQIGRVRPDAVPYTRVYDLTEFSTMTTDLHAHLRELGKDQELYLPRANETPLAITREVMAGGVKEQIEELYASDFEAYGHRWNFEDLKFVADGWNDAALSHAVYHTEANAWITQINEVYEARDATLRARLTSAKAENRRLTDARS